MEGDGDVIGVVFDEETGEAIGGATVYLNPESDKSLKETTTPLGSARFNDLPGGTDFALAAVAKHYEQRRMPMTGVGPGAVITRYIGLKRKPPESESEDGSEVAGE